MIPIAGKSALAQTRPSVLERTSASPVAPDRSRLKWSASSEVRGTVASVGARLLKGTAKKLTESFWDKFAARVGESSK